MSNIVVTGGKGMVGTFLKKYLPNAIYLSSQDYDLTLESDIKKLFLETNPSTIIHLAAKVGGILDNINKPAEYFDDNILMNTLILKYSYLFKIERFITVLSTCIYPDVVDLYPIKEKNLHSGPPTNTNFSYAYAKRSLAVQIDAYNKQYNTKYQYLIPCNLYGEFDKYGDNSHFVAALIKKIHIAKKNNSNKIKLLGSGKPLRQFMYADDLAYIIKYCLDNNIYDNMNVSVSENLSIYEIAKIALKACNAENLQIEFDLVGPDGQYRKDVSNDLLIEKISSFNPIGLYDGIKKTYNYLIENKIL